MHADAQTQPAAATLAVYHERRTRVLFEQRLPHPDELHWEPLGPPHLGLGTFMEGTCLHRASGSVLVTDALVAIGRQPSLGPLPFQTITTGSPSSTRSNSSIMSAGRRRTQPWLQGSPMRPGWLVPCR